MRTPSLALATFALTAMPAFGAALTADAALPPLKVPALFIAPSGQPFRSRAGEPYPVGKWFAAADANHDGKLDAAEFKADALAFFQVLDADHDGVVDDFEISTYEKELVPEILSPDLQGTNSLPVRGQSGAGLGVQGGLGGLGGQGAPGGLGGQGAPSGEVDPGGEVNKPPRSPGLDDGPAKGAAEFGLINDAEPIRSADRQFNSRITAQEFGEQANRNFKLLDVRKRGYLTLADLPTTPQQRDLTRNFRK